MLQEKLYTDKDYPEMLPGMANLEMSPLELGMSRADLWAFAAVLALGMELFDLWKYKNELLIFTFNFR